MFKKIIAGFLVLATSTLFGMSLNQLNNASKTELMEINGIGEVKANAIIKERRKGKFKSFEDFQRVEGIGEQTSKNVRNNVKSQSDVKKVTKSKKKTAKKVNKKTDVSKTKAKSKKDVKEKTEKKTKKSKKKTSEAKKAKSKKEKDSKSKKKK